MLIKIRIDDPTAKRLIEAASRESRPINWQAEFIIRKELGTLSEPKPAPNIREPRTRKQADCS
jgi:hypothetical protein